LFKAAVFLTAPAFVYALDDKPQVNLDIPENFANKNLDEITKEFYDGLYEHDHAYAVCIDALASYKGPPLPVLASQGDKFEAKVGELCATGGGKDCLNRARKVANRVVFFARSLGQVKNEEFCQTFIMKDLDRDPCVHFIEDLGDLQRKGKGPLKPLFHLLKGNPVETAKNLHTVCASNGVTEGTCETAITEVTSQQGNWPKGNAQVKDFCAAFGLPLSDDFDFTHYFHET
jgi:hypothetical protein